MQVSKLIQSCLNLAAHFTSLLVHLLFLISITDLPEGVQSTTKRLIDDCFVYQSTKTHNDVDILKMGLLNFENDSEMSFNPSKYEVLRVINEKPLIKTT